MEPIIIYGIPNCDTVKKTLLWFANNNIEYHFHDFKKWGITKDKLTTWCKAAGWSVLLNKKSTTWRSLEKEVQEKINTQQAAIRLMQQQHSIIKRPVIEWKGEVIVGFDESFWRQILNRA